MAKTVRNKVAWIALALLAIGIGLYPLSYLFAEEDFGLLLSKSDALLTNQIWNLAFYGHISLGGLAGGIIPSIGFISLGVIWLFTTLRAYVAVKKKDVCLHQGMMVYSYAACFAAVTLRIWLPLLSILFGEFLIAYKIVAWLCWVPNIIFAHFWVRKKGLNLV